MSIITLMCYIGIAAILLTLLMTFSFKVHKSYFMSFLQNFAGILFVFSGWVKAVDPMGTAFKMEDYFAEFNAAFSDSVFSFMAPIFPFLSDYALAFAIFMIIFEIVLGIMLLIGDRPKLTAWLFLLLVIFFTILTGYTYLTGFVPLDSTFFKFSTWTEYKASNMRVTDCGCFGDFIKLDPRISFFKDIFLLFPSFYFVFRWKDMHQLFSQKFRNLLILISTIFLILYCVYNFHWNEPHVDFRPFKNGTNVAAIHQAEHDAAQTVRLLAMKMKNKKTGEIKTVPYAEYMKNLSALTEEWETIEQISSEPSIKKSKISDFVIYNFEDEEVTDVYLKSKKPFIMVPVYHAEYEAIPGKRMVKDTIYITDTTYLTHQKDSFTVQKSVKEVKDKEETYYDIVWDEAFIERFKQVIKPLQDAAARDNVPMMVVVSGIDGAKAQLLAHETGVSAEYQTADEKLLKTIMRSNPGIILWKDGVILHKWHYKKLPSWQEIKQDFGL
jgi:uncharacterized membrane protein YphA (DoxX/SURF4 family)